MKSSGIFTLPLYFSIYCLMASLSSEPATCIVIVIQFALFLYIRALLSLVCFYLCDGWRLRLFCHFSLFLRFFYIWDILFSLFSFFILLRIFCQVFHIFCICCYTLAISSIPYFTVSIITYDIPMIMIKGPYATLFHFFRAMVNGLLGSVSRYGYTPCLRRKSMSAYRSPRTILEIPRPSLALHRSHRLGLSSRRVARNYPIPFSRRAFS